MKLPKVKAFFRALAITSVLTMIVPDFASAISMQFSTQSGVKQISHREATFDPEILEELVGLIKDTDFSDQDDLEELADTVKDFGVYTAEENPQLKDFQKASLVRVIDGDTIVVDVYGDKCGNKDHEYSVRLIGVNTPESVASKEYLEKTGKQNTETGKEASEFTSSLLDNYDYVYLETDQQDKDKYGRLLRYVWIENPTDNIDLTEISTDMLNGILLKEGYAEIATYYPNDKYEDYFKEICDDYESDGYDLE